MANGRVRSLRKNSPNIQMELATIQHVTARLCNRSSMVLQPFQVNQKAKVTVGTIIQQPNILKPAIHAKSFNSQNKIWRFSLLRKSIVMARKYSIF